MSDADVVVVGCQANGLAAAVTLATAGLVVTVVEGADTTVECRTESLTLPDSAMTCAPQPIPWCSRPRSSGSLHSTVSADYAEPEVPPRPPARRG